ncbi:beta-phosphoglucomutase family hydrolase [Nocardia heshunensis]
MAELGLPDAIAAALFDLDGVLTGTAALHERAWKQVFDEFLAARCGAGFEPFSLRDYEAHVDGLPRLDGVREFLRSRNITVPEGNSDGAGDRWTVRGIGDRKDRLLKSMIDHDGVRAYPGSAEYLSAVHAAGLRIGVVSSSANAAAVLGAAGLSGFIEVRVDGNTLAERNLPGKPAPDGFLAAAAALHVSPSHAAVFEDAVAGVEAGRAGAFGFVVGIEHAGDQRQITALRNAGADIVVSSFSDLSRS